MFDWTININLLYIIINILCQLIWQSYYSLKFYLYKLFCFTLINKFSTYEEKQYLIKGEWQVKQNCIQSLCEIKINNVKKQTWTNYDKFNFS